MAWCIWRAVETVKWWTGEISFTDNRSPCSNHSCQQKDLNILLCHTCKSFDSIRFDTNVAMTRRSSSRIKANGSTRKNYQEDVKPNIAIGSRVRKVSVFIFTSGCIGRYPNPLFSASTFQAMVGLMGKWNPLMRKMNCTMCSTQTATRKI